MLNSLFQTLFYLPGRAGRLLHQKQVGLFEQRNDLLEALLQGVNRRSWTGVKRAAKRFGKCLGGRPPLPGFKSHRPHNHGGKRIAENRSEERLLLCAMRRIADLRAFAERQCFGGNFEDGDTQRKDIGAEIRLGTARFRLGMEC